MNFFSWEHFVQICLDHYLIIILTITLAYFYNHYTANNGFFLERGVPFKKPTFILGNIGERFLMKTSFHDFVWKLYYSFPEATMAGFFEGRQPLFILRDPELIKTVMIKEFDHFVDRNVLRTEDPPHIKKMMINLSGKEWKNVRTILTPTFSSGKLRAMESIIQQCGNQLIEYLNNRLNPYEPMEMKEFTGRFTLEVIGSCAFGLDCASLKDPEAKFMQVASKFALVPQWKRIGFFLGVMLGPSLLKYLPVTVFNYEAIDELKRVLMETKKNRESSKQPHSDFLQLMLDIAEKEKADDSPEKVMTDEIIQAQAILFLVAGYDTTSILLSFASHVLATHQDIQDSLRDELMKISAENKDDKNIYDALNEAPLLNKVLLETLRLYPPVARVDRKCTKPITLPGMNFQINAGDVLVISIIGIMRDPEHYPNPEKFDPERFSPEEKLKRPSHLYLPFGMGPRNCIGLRFGMIAAKFALYKLLTNYKLDVCDKTDNPISFDKKSFLLKPKNGVWVKIVALKK